jgi:large subunit ribosomal protein L10
LDRKEKETFVVDMRERLEKATATFVVDYQGLDVDAMNRLRRELKQVGTEFQVVKNRLLTLASQETDSSSIQEHFRGPCALAITYDEIATPAKVLVDLSKEMEKLEIKIGQIAGRPMGPEDIKRLADLPNREQLLAQVLSAMQGVPAALVRVLNGVLVQLMNVLHAIETKKAEGA